MKVTRFIHRQKLFFWITVIGVAYRHRCRGRGVRVSNSARFAARPLTRGDPRGYFGREKQESIERGAWEIVIHSVARLAFRVHRMPGTDLQSAAQYAAQPAARYVARCAPQCVAPYTTQYAAQYPAM